MSNRVAMTGWQEFRDQGYLVTPAGLVTANRGEFVLIVVGKSMREAFEAMRTLMGAEPAEKPGGG